MADRSPQRGDVRPAAADTRGRIRAESAPRALVTGFEPYNQAEINPSGEIVAALDSSSIGDLEAVGRLLPVSASKTPPAVRAAIDEVAPTLVLMLGVWPGRQALSVERVAINVLDFPYPDNDGAQPHDVPVDEDGPAAYLTSIALRAVIEDWRHAGLPGVISDTAGTYVCNQSYYTALRHTAGTGTPVAFVHLPTVPSEAARREPPLPSMPLPSLVEGARVALAAIARTSVAAS